MSLNSKATLLKLRSGTTAEHAAFTGAKNELTADEDKKILVFHDEETPGGIPVNPVPVLGIALWNQANPIPSGWTLCDGSNGTPNMPSITSTDSKTIVYIMLAGA